MGVDVGGGGEGAVSQPDLDLLHGDSIAQQQAGTGVTKIVEADLPQTVLADHPAKVFRHEVGPQELAHLVHADIGQIVPTVGTLEQPPILGLLFFLRQQQVLHHRDQRQGAEAGLGLEYVLPYRYILTIHVCLNYLVRDRDGFLFEVNGVPAQTQHLAAPQAVVGGNLDAELQGVARNGIEQRKHLILAVKATVKNILFGSFYLVSRIFGKDVLFYCTLKRLADNGMVVDHRIGGTAVVEDGLVEVLDVLGREVTELNFGGCKVRDHPGFHHNGVALVGGRGNGLADTVPTSHFSM